MQTVAACKKALELDESMILDEKLKRLEFLFQVKFLNPKNKHTRLHHLVGSVEETDGLVFLEPQMILEFLQKKVNMSAECAWNKEKSTSYFRKATKVFADHIHGEK